MADRRRINVVTLGQTGAGKSTTINSMNNFMAYETLGDALEHNQPKVVVDSKFTLMTKVSNEMIDIRMGGLNPKEAESDKVGRSATTLPVTYSFVCGNVEFNVIDVPGIGDTGGIQQDGINKTAIIKEIGKLDVIHGIFIIVKSNQTRITNEFQYCLCDILSCLHQNAQENIFFIVTNAGSDHFLPQQVKPILETFLDELKKSRNIKLTLDDRIYCIDNEPFRFLCGYNQSKIFRREFGRQIDLDRMDDYWKESRKNIFKVFEKMYSITPHETKETVTVAQSNSAIQAIISILTTIMDLIAESLSKEHREKSIKQLMGEGTFDKPDVQISSNTPQLVCAHKDCINLSIRNGRLANLKFKQICHDNCIIEGVKIARFPEPKLIHCQMFDLNMACRECSHSHKEHMHLTYNIIKTVSKIGEGKKLDQKTAEAQFNAFVKSMENERDEIIRNMMTMAIYCNKNAIVAYNTAFIGQIEVEMRSAQEAGKFKELEKIKKMYDDVSKTFETANNFKNSTTISDVTEAFDNLYKLKFYGKRINELFRAQTSKLGDEDCRNFIRLNVKFIP